MVDVASTEAVFAGLIRLLVRYPERVNSAVVTNALGQTIQIGVDKADLGIVIGKHGRTARSLRILLGGISAKGGERLTLEISENLVDTAGAF